MCNPLEMLTFAIGAVQNIAGFIGQQQAYQQQEQFRLDNIKRANEAAKEQYNATLQRKMQEEDAAGIQKEQVTKDARAAVATAKVAAGEAGVSGLSVDALIADYYGRKGSYIDQLDQQTEWTSVQLQNETKGIRATAEDRANSIAKARPPSFLGAALRIGGAGVGAYGSYLSQLPKA